MREFSDLEKVLIRRISDKTGNNLQNLIHPYLSGVGISVNTQTNVANIFFQNAYPQQYLIEFDTLTKKAEEIEELIIQSVNLIKLLEEKGYIFTYTRASKIENIITYGMANPIDLTTNFTLPDKRISELLTKYSTQYIFVTKELPFFVAHNFVSREELRFRRSFLIAMIALTFAIIGTLANLYFNLKKEYCTDGQKIDKMQFERLINKIDSMKTSSIK